MAYYETGTFTTANALITSIKAFAEANGWTIDNYTTGTNNRLHLHQGEHHFSMQATSTTAIAFYGCTGYSSGSAYNAQPGPSAVQNLNAINNGIAYTLISVKGGIYLRYLISATYRQLTGFFAVQDKVGSWSGGACVLGASNTQEPFLATTLQSLYFGSAWTGTAAAGGLIGGSQGLKLTTKAQPCEYNAAIIPMPSPLFIGLSTNGALLQPIGFVPGLYHCSGGDVYSVDDIITIGADQYIIQPAFSVAMNNTSYGDYLFKLGA